MATWLVTGANRGIGLGLVGKLAARGDRVLACCRNPTEATGLTALAIRMPEHVAVYRMDVTDGASVAAARDLIGGGAIDALVNNAGAFGPARQDALDMDYDGFTRTLSVNTIAPLRVANAFADNLRAARNGRIVTITSAMGALSSAGGGYVAYRASKAAVNKTMQGLAAELAGDKVCVVVVHPGWVRTDMGGAGADLSVDESAAGIVATIDRLTMADTGHFLNWDGKRLAW